MRLSVLQRNQFEQSVCGIAAAGHTIGVFRWFTGLKYDYNSLLSPKSSCRACIFRTATTALRWNIAHVRAYTRFTDNIQSDGWHFRHSTRDSPRAHWPAAAASAEKERHLEPAVTGFHFVTGERSEPLPDRGLFGRPLIFSAYFLSVPSFVSRKNGSWSRLTTSLLSSADYFFSLIRWNISILYTPRYEFHPLFQ